MSKASDEENTPRLVWHHDHNALIILFTICVLVRLGSGYDITDINFNNTSGLLLLVYNNALHSICHHGEPNTWGKREAIVSCKQLGYHGGWPTELTVSNGPSLHLFNFDCDGTEKDIKNCGYEIADNCLNSKLAGINCYDSFDIRLAGGPSQNAGNVEVKYDDTWSNVCYVSKESETRQWSFYNAHVVCTELGFPGTMVARQGGFDKGIRTSIVDGFKCREDLRDQSLSECLPDTPRENATSCGFNNEAVAICAGPGYLGCYITAALTAFVQEQSPNMTTQVCRNHCRTYNYTYAFLHASDTCSCGNDLSGKPMGDIECREECAGNKDQVCGGNDKASVYKVEVGICNDPLNGTDIYYYGDFFIFTCGPRKEPGGTFNLQCVRVSRQTPDEVAWNASLPICKEKEFDPTSTIATYNPRAQPGVSQFFLEELAMVGLQLQLQNTRDTTVEPSPKDTGDWRSVFSGVVFFSCLIMICTICKIPHYLYKKVKRNEQISMNTEIGEADVKSLKRTKSDASFKSVYEDAPTTPVPVPNRSSPDPVDKERTSVHNDKLTPEQDDGDDAEFKDASQDTPEQPRKTISGTVPVESNSSPNDGVEEADEVVESDTLLVEELEDRQVPLAEEAFKSDDVLDDYQLKVPVDPLPEKAFKSDDVLDDYQMPLLVTK